MKDKMFDKLKTKLENEAKRFFHKATPIVKREIKKSVSKGAVETKDNAIKAITIGGTVLVLMGFGSKGGSALLSTPVEEACKVINITYSVTNNYYGKEI